MKNHILHMILISIMIIGLGSCKKSFLDVAGTTSPLYRENYVKDLSSMGEYLNGIYLEFSVSWSGVRYSGYPELAADNLKPINTSNTDVMSKYNWMQDPYGEGEPLFYTSNMSLDWNYNYRVIRECSFVLEDTDKYRRESPAKADYIKGQALFFRAIMYFKLVNVFAQPYEFTSGANHPGIPCITTSDLSAPYSRQSVKQVYEAIIKDLKNAIILLSSTSVSDSRYVSIDAANALLARVYLFKGEYEAALNLSKQICIKYPLMTIASGYPNSLFLHKSNRDSEVIFQATPELDPFTPTFFLGRFLKGVSTRFYATADIATLLRENSNDVRSSWVNFMNGNWSVLKFPSGVASINSVPETDYYDPVIRSSEMFLIVAETAFKTGDENTARTYLNAIRKRADPAILDITASGDSLIAAIYKERRKELCFENFRLFDLQRCGMAINRVDVLPGSPSTLAYPNNKRIAPIPQKDINVAGLTQNLGY